MAEQPAVEPPPGKGGGVDETRIAFIDALTRGDATAAAAVYADDARLVGPSAELMRGRAAIEAFWQEGVKAGLVGVELREPVLAHHGALALEIGEYTLRLEPLDGRAVVDNGRYVLVLEQQNDGSWLRVLETLNACANSGVAHETTSGAAISSGDDSAGATTSITPAARSAPTDERRRRRASPPSASGDS